MTKGEPKRTWSLEDARNVVAVFDANVAKTIHGVTFALDNPLPYQGVVFHELLKRRARDTVAGVLVLCQNDLIVPAMLLTRAAFEILAFAFEFHRHCEAYLANEKGSKLPEFLEKAILGVGKHAAEQGELIAIHINDHLRALEKAHPGTEAEYNKLSEYAHPNRAGMLTAYAKVDSDNYKVDMGANDLSTDLAMTPLARCHVLFTEYSNRLSHVLKAINDKYESRESKFNIVGHINPKPSNG